MPADQLEPRRRSPRGRPGCSPAVRSRSRSSTRCWASICGSCRPGRAGRRRPGARGTRPRARRARRPAILTAERTALNLLTHLSGIATRDPGAGWTRSPAPARGSATPARPCPGLRALEKYAVRCGGGVNHRMSLGDAALIKDNHVAAAGSVSRGDRGGARAAIRTIAAGGRGRHPRPARRGGRRRRVDSFCWTTSRPGRHGGGGPPGTGAATARGCCWRPPAGSPWTGPPRSRPTGVDFLAVGALTHSAPALDLGLDLSREPLALAPCCSGSTCAPASATLRGVLPRAAVDIGARPRRRSAPLIDDVRRRGAAAVLDATERFDGVRPPALRVPAEVIETAAADSADPRCWTALTESIAPGQGRPRGAAAAARPSPPIAPGGTVTQRWVPVRPGRAVRARRAGAVPVQRGDERGAGAGGRACGRSPCTSPPQRDNDGWPDRNVLAACALLGVDEVYAAGGAQGDRAARARRDRHRRRA